MDANGNAYLGGYTASTPTFSKRGEVLFPVTPGARSRVDVFVTKLNADGSAVLYSAVFGGSGDDELEALEVDASSGQSTAVDRPASSRRVDPGRCTRPI